MIRLDYNKYNMPQLDFFSYLTSVFFFGFIFFISFLLINLLFLSLSFRQLIVRSFFSVENLFQFIGGVTILNGIVLFFVHREQLVYRFNTLLLSNVV